VEVVDAVLWTRRLTSHREVIAIDLPVMGESHPVKETTIALPADAVTVFYTATGWSGID